MSTRHEQCGPAAGHTRRRRMAWLLGGTAAAAALAGVVAASQPYPVAADQPAPAHAYIAPDPGAYEHSAERMPVGLRKAVRRDLGLDPASYLAAADAARSASTAVASLGDSVDDAWIDKDLVLHVTVKTAQAAKAARSAGAQVQEDDPLAAQAKKRNAADDGRTYWVDRARNKVVSYDSSSMRTLESTDTTLAGGYGFVFSVAGGKARCSLGFFGTGAFGQPLNFTAGHCVEGSVRASDTELLDLDTPTANGGKPKIVGAIGTPGSGNIGLGDDGGIINITDPDRTTPTVSTWGGGQGSQDDGDRLPVYDATGVITGMPVCKSGSTTGWTCGRTTVPETTEIIGNGAGGIAGEVTGFLFDACILSGDSGGAIVSGNYAVGVDSFGNMRTCADAGTEGKLAGGFAVVSGTRNAETMFGDHFNLDIHVGAPEITGVKPAESRNHRPARQVLSGTVAAAPGATLCVRIDGSRKLTTTVGDGGTWSLHLPPHTRPGRHTVTATASHTPQGSDLTTTGHTTRTTINIPAA